MEQNDLISINKFNMISYAGETFNRMFASSYDGLKPVMRRILWSMFENNYYINFKKSGKVVGMVLGDYHPHGDASIYGTLVGMTQQFKLNNTFITPSGNFGKLTGDPAAAMRYTECKLSPFAMNFMLNDLDDTTVDYKETETMEAGMKEPVYIPTSIPLVLVNGSQGIGVAYAASIPPHNPNDVADMCINYINDKNITNIKLVDGLYPDFPTGGIICNKSDLERFYKYGEKASVILRGELEIDAPNNTIFIKSLPFNVFSLGVNIAIVKKIKDDNVILNNINSVNDDIKGLDVNCPIVYREGCNPIDIVGELYKTTPLENNFTMSFYINRDDKPLKVDVLTIIKYWYSVRSDILRRKFTFQISKDEIKKHVREGLLLSYDNIDEIIKLIKSSRTDEEMLTGMMKKFKFTKIQADGISKMKLKSLSRISKDDLSTQIKTLEERIKEMNSNLHKIDEIIIDSLYKYKEKYGRPRRSKLIDLKREGNNIDITNGLILVAENYISLYEPQKLITNKTITGNMRKRKVENVTRISNKFEHIVIFTDNTVKRIHKKDVHGLQLWANVASRHIKRAIPVYDDIREVVVITKKQNIKRMAIDTFTSNRDTNMEPIMSIGLIRPTDTHVIIATDKGNYKKLDLNEIPLVTKKSNGVKLTFKHPFIKLFIEGVNEADTLVVNTKSDAGYFVTFNIAELPVIKRTNNELKLLSFDNMEVLSIATVKNDQESTVLMIGYTNVKQLTMRQILRASQTPKKNTLAIGMYQS